MYDRHIIFNRDSLLRTYVTAIRTTCAPDAINMNHSSTYNMGAYDRVYFRSNRRDILILSAALECLPLCLAFESSPPLLSPTQKPV